MKIADGTLGAIMTPPASLRSRRAPDVMDEKALVKACRAGDSTALRRYVEAYYDRVFRVARTLVRHPDEAEDLTQETFTASFKAISRFRGDSGLLTWLVSILRNQWLHRLRRKKRVVYMGEVDAGTDDESAAERSDAATDLQAAFHQLDDDDRVILELYHYEELDYEQISQAMEMPLGTVKSKMHHARKRLKSILE